MPDTIPNTISDNTTADTKREYRVLVIEDNPSGNITLYCDSLKDAFHVELVTSISEARHRLLLNPPIDAIVLDLRLPSFPETEAEKLTKLHFKSIPLILIEKVSEDKIGAKETLYSDIPLDKSNTILSIVAKVLVNQRVSRETAIGDQSLKEIKEMTQKRWDELGKK